MTANNFLDQAGLSYLWTKIVAAIESHSVILPDKLVSYKAATAITATEKLNADTLGGYSASYFAKSSDVSSIQGSIKTQASEILKAQQAIPVLTENKLDKSGGTMTGKLIAQSNEDYAVAQIRNIIISTEEPSAEVGSNGDIWIRYTE